MVATPGEELLRRDWKNFTHLASNSPRRLVCGLASHLTCALGVALLSPQLVHQVLQHLVNCWADSLFQSMAPYMSGTWVGAAKAEL